MSGTTPATAGLPANRFASPGLTVAEIALTARYACTCAAPVRASSSLIPACADENTCARNGAFAAVSGNVGAWSRSTMITRSVTFFLSALAWEPDSAGWTRGAGAPEATVAPAPRPPASSTVVTTDVRTTRLFAFIPLPPTGVSTEPSAAEGRR